MVTTQHARKYNAFMFVHEKIKIRRIELGLTMTDLADRMRLYNHAVIGFYENAKQTHGGHTISKLATALDVPIGYFFDLKVACSVRNNRIWVK